MSRIVPETPKNALTPSAISVATTTGFNQGDLVYQSNTGNFGRIPDNAISSDLFDINQNSPIMATPINGGVVLASNTTGSSYGRSVATLSNGNIVSVYVAQPGNNVAFKVTDENNVVVVAETIVSTVFRTGFSNVSVAALSGGGFVVTWINTISGGTTNSVCYAVYANDGTVTLAAAQDLTLGSGTFSSPSYLSYPLALPNGNFVIAASNTSNQALYRIYNANGTGAFAATSNTGSNLYLPAHGLGLAARSDSSFIIFGTNNSTVAYFITSASNTAIANATFTSPNLTVINSVSVDCLTDGTTFAIGYAGSIGSTPFNRAIYRFLPSGNVLSAETLFTSGISNSDNQTFKSVTIKALAAGNFIFLASENGGLINYAVFNSSGVCISGIANGQPIPKRIWAGQVRVIGNWNTVIVTSSSINIYWAYANSSTNSAFGLVQSYVRLDLNTSDPIPVNGVTRQISTATAAVNGYNIGTATPTNAKFSPASTSLISSAQSMGFVGGETTIDVACFALHSASLNNGNFVVVYVSRTSPFPITAAIYTFSGQLVTRFVVSFNGTNINRSVAVASLTGGGFAVAYVTGSANPFTLSVATYTASGSFVGTSVVTTTLGFDNSQRSLSVSGITNNRFVVNFSNNSNSSNSSFRVYDNNCVALTAAIDRGNGFQGSSVAGYPAGGFAMSQLVNADTASRLVRFNETSTNTFSQVAAYNFSNATSSAVSTARVAISSNNQAALIGVANSQSGFYLAMPYDVSSSFFNETFSEFNLGTSFTSFPTYACCFTAYGNVVFVNTRNFARFFTLPVGVNGNTSNISTTLDLTAANFVNTDAESQVNLAPLYGNVVLFTFKDANFVPKFALFNATPYTQTQQLTAGVSASNGVQISPTIGFSLAGVAATTAAAGSIGLVQTGGAATLNSSYSASTPLQGFDYQDNTGIGVKGSITGRSVTLQGNS